MDQATAISLLTALGTIGALIVAVLAWRRATEANAIARRALEAQTATRINVRCRQGGLSPLRAPRQFPPPFPPGVVIAVGENVGGLPVTIESAWVVFPGPGYEHAFPLIPTDTGEQFPFPELPHVLAPRSVLQVPVSAQWFHQRIPEQLAMFADAPEREFVLRLESDTGVLFNSSPIHVNRFHEDCPSFVQGASDPLPRPPLIARLRARITR